MILFIDSSDLKKVKFALITDKKVASKNLTIPYEENYKTLEHLEKFLKSHRISWSFPQKRESRNKNWILNQVQDDKTITHIIICSGPGSFTGLRVGAAISQAIGLVHHIPITAIKKASLPKNLKALLKIKPEKKLEIEYGRPAVY